MARFVYDEGGDHPFVRLEAQQGEEIPVEMAAWAAMRQAWALDQIGDNLIGIDNAITRLADAVGEKSRSPAG